MADERPPPPSYHSLFQGDPQAGPSTVSAPPILPPDAPPDVITGTPPLGATGRTTSRSFSRQASLESPYPPSHPFYPCPINLPPLTPDEPPGAAIGGQPGGAAEGGSPLKCSNNNLSVHGGGPSQGHVPVQMGAPVPVVYPPPGGSTPAAKAHPSPPPSYNPTYPPATAPYPPPGQPTPSDPLINPPYNPDIPPSYPSSAASHYPRDPDIQSPTVDLVNIPIIIDDDDGCHDPFGQEADPVNPLAPDKCQLSTLEHYPDLHIPEGQRQHIDQLDPTEGPAYCKWCTVAFFSLGSHIGFIICVCVLVWQVPLKWYHDNSSWPEGVSSDDYSYGSLITASVFLVVCWLVAITEGYVSDTRSYVENTMKLADFRKDHTKVRNMVPKVVWSAEAYHYDKERVVWKDGVIIGRRRSSDTHKCVTKFEVVAFQFSKCVDASGDLDTFQKGVINRFEFEKTFGFMDVASAAEYEQSKKNFLAQFEGFDEKFKFEEKLVLPEMKERATVFMTEGCRTSLMSTTFYGSLTCFLLTWPYRIFFRCATRKKKFTFVKLLGI